MSATDLLAECNTAELVEDYIVKALSQLRLCAGSSSLFVSGRYDGQPVRR